MPSTAEKIWEQLNIGGDISKVNILNDSQWGKLKPGITIQKGAALFPRIEKKKE
jgi:methionyl-tRNA synthetase